MRITEALVFSVLPNSGSSSRPKKCEIISLLCFARPSTRVGRQWLVKIRLHRW